MLLLLLCDEILMSFHSSHNCTIGCWEEWRLVAIGWNWQWGILACHTLVLWPWVSDLTSVSQFFSLVNGDSCFPTSQGYCASFVFVKCFEILGWSSRDFGSLGLVVKGEGVPDFCLYYLFYCMRGVAWWFSSLQSKHSANCGSLFRRTSLHSFVKVMDGYHNFISPF